MLFLQCQNQRASVLIKRIVLSVFLAGLILNCNSAFCLQVVPDTVVIDQFDATGDLSRDMDHLAPFRMQKSTLNLLNKSTIESRLEVARKNNRSKAIAILANNLGLIYFKEGKYANAISYFMESLEARKQTGDVKGIALTQGEIGYVHFVMMDYNNAVIYFNSSLVVLKEEKMYAAVGLTSRFLAESYLKKKDYEQALTFYRLALSAYTETNDKKTAANLINKTGEVKLIQRKYNDASESFNNALKMALDSKDSVLVARINRNLGILELYKENYLDAEAYLLTSLKFKKNAPQTEKYLKETYSKLASKYQVEHDATKTFYYTQRYQEVKSILSGKNENSIYENKKTDPNEKENIIEFLNLENKKQYSELSQNQLEMKQLMTSVELERLNNDRALEELNLSLSMTEKAKKERDQEIEKLKLEKVQLDLLLAQNEKELYRKTKNNILLLSITALVLLLAFFLYNRFRYKQKSLIAINQAYRELKSAQQQLIQSEKMATLGQLTAGIAHEIQNPLNFVNNFSEINVDLLNEFEKSDNAEERNELIATLKENFQRIREHGQRADSIVKGMLEHSRTGTSTKQPVDLNKLCLEFFNLAYHGMRAKDSSFNCTLEKNLDETLPEIQVVQQDISRVLINLFNNAFYSVNEKAKDKNATDASSYKPRVGISTSFVDNLVLIRVQDNGGGIPSAIMEKIFNPFFTTKAAGAGTGLGLSLSYDIIVKGHAGKLTAQSNKSDGTLFTIALPIL